MSNFVSIIIPCRNEEKYIHRCLDSIIANDYPTDQIEVFVIEGRSTDRTPEICSAYAKKYPFIKLLDNPGKMQTLGTNIGLKKANGDIIIRMDAHVEYPQNYIFQLLSWLKEREVDCVGGIMRTRPGDSGTKAEAIALALPHPFGVGNSLFRIGITEPRYVNTVPYGCYKKEVFEKIGLFNENLDRTDDLEFNLRLKRAGGKILLVPEIESYYYARATLSALAKQNYANGLWVVYSLKFVKLPFSMRHLVPMAFVISLLSSLVLSLIYLNFIYLFAFVLSFYLIANLYFSFTLSLKKRLKLFPDLVLSFLTLHFSYGFGSMEGIYKLCWGKFR